ncbi:hypothetical protein LIA77_00855 [Sarocladium implicatum]|nr:hypothetical protein LIA77_00855 [Sarocladium implicatum]
MPRFGDKNQERRSAHGPGITSWFGISSLDHGACGGRLNKALGWSLALLVFATDDAWRHGRMALQGPLPWRLMQGTSVKVRCQVRANYALSLRLQVSKISKIDFTCEAVYEVLRRSHQQCLSCSSASRQHQLPAPPPL